MKLLCLLLSFLMQRLCSDAGIENLNDHSFRYQRYDAAANALNDDSVHTLLMDSTRKLWVGTATGLTVYNGREWTKRQFLVAAGKLTRSIIRSFGGSDSCGPRYIVESPPGTVWLGGDFGVWRVRNGEYQKISSNSEIAGMLGMTVDQQGNVWVVHKTSVFKFDGRDWTLVLRPYVGKPASREAPGLHSIAAGTNGSIWIGGTVYGEPAGPWEHDGASWVVGQKTRAEGPPMAPLFHFDGNRWRAFGAPHGLKVGSATPELTGEGSIRVWTAPNKQYVLDNKNWKPVSPPDVPVGKQWFFTRKKNRTDLLFRDGDRIIPVRAKHYLTNEVLDFGREQLLLLHLTAQSPDSTCVWVGTSHGLFRIWLEPPSP
jgi:hypothetical protein